MLNALKQWNNSRKWRQRAKNMETRRDKMLSLGRHAFAILLQGKYGTFAVNPEDDFVSRELLETGNYSEEELELARRLTPRDGHILMVGTHIGALAVPLSKCCGQMVAVEANPDTFKLLSINFLLNKCGNVTTHNLAAAEGPGKIKFLLSRDNSGGSKRLPKNVDVAYVYDNPEVAEVRAEPLDAVVGRTAFDLILMDIEGSEYFALKGMTQILADSRSLVVEFLPHHLRNVAGVDAAAFIGLLLPHFDWLYIPNRDRIVAKSDIAATAQALYVADEGHAGLVFLKSPLPDWLHAKCLSPEDSRSG